MKKCLKGNSDIKKRMSLIKGCKAELRKKNIKFIDGVPLHMCKHKVISNKYCEIFNRNPLDDYRKSDYNRKIEKDNYIYIVLNSINNTCKIGYSNSPKKRLKDLQVGSSDLLELYLVFKGDKCVEKKLHKKYNKYRLNGEWFSFKDTLKNKLEYLKKNNNNNIFII